MLYCMLCDVLVYASRDVISPQRGLIKLYCTVLDCLVLDCFVLSCMVLYCIVLYCKDNSLHLFMSCLLHCVPLLL